MRVRGFRSCVSLANPTIPQIRQKRNKTCVKMKKSKLNRMGKTTGSSKLTHKPLIMRKISRVTSRCSNDISRMMLTSNASCTIASSIDICDTHGVKVRTRKFSVEFMTYCQTWWVRHTRWCTIPHQLHVLASRAKQHHRCLMQANGRIRNMSDEIQ